MTAKEYREKYFEKDLPDFDSLPKETQEAITRLTTGVQVSFIRALPKKQNQEVRNSESKQSGQEEI